MNFSNPQSVKDFLKSKGITHPLNVRTTRSPFGGNHFYAVRIHVPDGILIGSRTTPRGTVFFSKDNGLEYVAVLNSIQSMLTGTNAFAST